MILIPQLYIKSGRAVPLENTKLSLFSDDAYATARAMMEAGSEAIYITDLNVSPAGQNPNIAAIGKIKTDLKIKLFVNGAFRAAQSIEPYVELGADLVVLDAHAYQQPLLVKEVCRAFPNRCCMHIDVRDGHVTIPGYTVAANKTAFDYVEQFRELGIKTFFYSNMTSGDRAEENNLNELLSFCKKVQAPTYCTNEIYSLGEIEKLITLGAPRLEGLILAKSLYQGRIELRAANSFVADMMQDSNNEPTLQDW